MLRTNTISMLVACVSTLLCNFVLAAELSPYGVCAHVSRHGDHELADQEFKLMRQAGIRWARTDFDWTTVEPVRGSWDFSMIDATVEKAQQAGITILPILAYDVPWAKPAHRHLDQWLEYVRKTVGRYHDRIRCWEVWNEPDLEQFWNDVPDPASYTAMLKATYEEIKKIDPDLTVVLGGLSGIPYGYIEGVYKAGGKDFFDVMAVHPYRYPLTPEARPLDKNLGKLRQLMAEYGDAEKPVWMTEIGWPTHENGSLFLDGIVRCGLHTISPERENWTLAVFEDPTYPAQNAFSDSRLNGMVPGSGRIVRLTLDQMQNLSADRHHALIMPPEEGFAAELFDYIETYVRNGGIVIFTQGVPLYYAYNRAEDGSWQHGNADPSYRRRLHIGWEAWWTRPGVPKEAATLEVPQPFESKIRIHDFTGSADRFLTDAHLKGQDRFIPLLCARSGKFSGTCAAALDLNSELKGAVLVSTIRHDFRGITQDKQALLLPRTYLIALHSGVDRVFWYNLRAREKNPFYNEDHFGIVHSDLQPKPAYMAMQTLSRARPAGSVPLEREWQKDTFYCPGWRRPDGQTAFALWTTDAKKDFAIDVTGTVKHAYDHLGEPVNLARKQNKVRLHLSSAPIYLIGPTEVDLMDTK